MKDKGRVEAKRWSFKDSDVLQLHAHRPKVSYQMGGGGTRGMKEEMHHY